MPLGSQFRCQECRRLRRGSKHRTSLGRTVCAECNDKLSAMQFGMLAGGGEVGRSMLMTKSIEAMRGYFRRRR